MSEVVRAILTDALESNSEALLITNHERMIREARLLLLQTN